MDDERSGQDDRKKRKAAASSKDDTRPLQDRPPRDEQSPPPAAVLSEATLDWPAAPPEPMEETGRVRAVPSAPEPRAWRVILQTLHGIQTKIGLNVWHELVIGRSGEEESGAPDLDLSPHRAAELGISRQHAALVPGHDSLYLVDLDSTNGTWINRRYLAPHQRYPLKSGDRIELGLLRLVVRLVEPLKR